MLNETSKQPHKKRNKKKILAIVVVLLVLILGVVETKSLLHTAKQRHDKTDSDMSALNSKVAKLEKQSESLSNSLNETNVRLLALTKTTKQTTTPATQDVPSLTTTVTGVTKDSRGYVHQTNNNLQVIIVDLSVTNKSDSVAYLVPGDFKLKDSEQRSYSPDTTSSWPPAANKVLLKAQSVAAGETITGSISFANMPVSLTSLTLHYNDQAFDIVPKDATYPSWD